MQRVSLTLSSAANASVVALLILALGAWGYRSLRPTPQLSREAPVPAIGAPVDAQSLRAAAADGRVLVIYVHSACSFCTESIPFYRQVVGMASTAKRRIVFSGAQSESELKRYLSAHGLDHVNVMALKPDEPRLPWTPAIMLLSQGGILQKLWVGRQSASNEERITQALLAADE